MGFHELEERTQEIQAGVHEQEAHRERPTSEMGREVIAAKMESAKSGLSALKGFGQRAWGGFRDKILKPVGNAGAALIGSMTRENMGRAIERGERKLDPIRAKINMASINFSDRCRNSYNTCRDRVNGFRDRTTATIKDIPDRYKSYSWNRKLDKLQDASFDLDRQGESIDQSAEYQIAQQEGIIAQAEMRIDSIRAGAERQKQQYTERKDTVSQTITELINRIQELEAQRGGGKPSAQEMSHEQQAQPRQEQSPAAI